MFTSDRTSEAAGTNVLSIALIGPDEDRRRTIADALQAAAQPGPESSGVSLAIEEFAAYPLETIQLPRMLALQFDVVLVDLDGDTDRALSLVETVSATSPAISMVYSVRAHRDLAIRCMRAGAREFLNLPLAPDDVAGALARVPLRASSPGRTRPASSKLFVFLGTKGGCGVTRIASRFALSLARDSGKSTLLIDLGLPLGDAALQLGMLCNYSTENALEDWTRLDANFLRTLLAEHVSGLSVLAAPKEFPKAQAPLEAVNKLLDVARSGFHYIVADLGSRLDLRESSLFDESAYLYLVTQAGISDLRNANHLITQLFSARRHRLQVVVNRDVPGAAGCDDDAIERTLSRPVEWRVPDEDATGMGGRPEAIPLAAEDSAVSRSIRQMARSACGLPPAEAQKRGFRFFGSDRRSQAEPEQNSRMASVVASAVVRGERV